MFIRSQYPPTRALQSLFDKALKPKNAGAPISLKIHLPLCKCWEKKNPSALAKHENGS